ncbi:MAG: barstar family protein [Bacteroidia bacterium]
MKEQFFRYISGQNAPEEFGHWLYNTDELENTIGKTLYLELVTVNLKSKEAKTCIIEIVKQILEWNEYIEWERIEDEKHIDRISNSQITIDLHELLKQELKFPNFYGKNHHALWDAITGLAPMPKVLTFTNWASFSKKLPDSADMLSNIIKRYNGLEYHEKQIRIENVE